MTIEYEILSNPRRRRRNPRKKTGAQRNRAAAKRYYARKRAEKAWAADMADPYAVPRDAGAWMPALPKGFHVTKSGRHIKNKKRRSVKKRSSKRRATKKGARKRRASKKVVRHSRRRKRRAATVVRKVGRPRRKRRLLKSRYYASRPKRRPTRKHQRRGKWYAVRNKKTRRLHWRNPPKRRRVLHRRRNPLQIRGFLSSIKAQLRGLLSRQAVMTVGSGVVGVGAALALPIHIARLSGRPQLNRGPLGALLSAVSAVIAGSVARAVGLRGLAPGIYMGGLIAAGLKLAVQFLPASVKAKYLPLGELGGFSSTSVSAAALPGPSAGGTNGLGRYYMTGDQLVASEVGSLGRGGSYDHLAMGDYMTLAGMRGMGDFLSMAETLPQAGAGFSMTGSEGEQF